MEKEQQLNEALASLINNAVASAEKAGDFLVSELPDVAQQLIQWTIVSHLLSFLTISIILGVFGIALYKHSKYIYFDKIEHDDYPSPKSRLYLMARAYDVEDLSPMHISTTVTLFVVNFVLCIEFMFQLFDLTWLQAWLAPKVFLIEYAANLIK